MRDKGIHIREGFPCFLTTAHSDADIEAIVRAFEESAIEMRQAGFFDHVGADSCCRRTDATLRKPGTKKLSQAPVTESQLEVWLSDQLSEEASCSYNESVSLHLRGNVNEMALRQALNLVVSRHQALRATFGSEGNIQNFACATKLDLPTVDLTSLAPDRARNVGCSRSLRRMRMTAFELSEGPLVRAQLVKMTASIRF